MEQFLNLAWLAMAIGLFSAAIPCARRRQAAGEAPTGHLSLVFVAVLCAAGLLFPIISVTDDLQFDVQALEEWTGRRIQIVSVHSSHHDSFTGTRETPILLSAIVALAFVLTLLALVQTAGVPTHVELLADCANPRSPPLR
jgi:hypothetical protein